MSTQGAPQDESLEQLGQRAHHSIAAAKKHDLRGTNLWLSAGLTLLTAKVRLKHGEWLPYLDRHKISERSAQKAMKIASAVDPHAETERMREQQREADGRYSPKRRKSASTDSDLNSNVVPIARAKRPPHYTELSPEGKRRVDECCLSIYREEFPCPALTS